jgi:hypothetical protein
MNPANWIIGLCATGAHNYTAIVACILHQYCAGAVASRR